MLTIQICKIVNQTQALSFGNSPKKDIQIHPILKIYPNVVRAMQTFTTRRDSFQNVAHSKYMTAINRAANNCRSISIIAKLQSIQPKIEKAYQTSVSDENFEPVKHDALTDPMSYNIHHEPFNDDYDKNYDDYQSYGDEISDSIMGKTDVNFINPSAPSVEFQHTCDRCRESFNSRNRFFSHLRLNCWKSNANDKPFHEKAIAMVTNETPPNVTSLPVITFSTTAVENTGYAFKNWHYTVFQVHWEIDCFKPIDIYADNGCTMFIIDRVYFQTVSVWKNIKIKRMVFKIPIRSYQRNKIPTEIQKLGNVYRHD